MQAVSCLIGQQFFRLEAWISEDRQHRRRCAGNDQGIEAEILVERRGGPDRPRRRGPRHVDVGGFPGEPGARLDFEAAEGVVFELGTNGQP